MWVLYRVYTAAFLYSILYSICPSAAAQATVYATMWRQYGSERPSMWPMHHVAVMEDQERGLSSLSMHGYDHGC